MKQRTVSKVISEKYEVIKISDSIGLRWDDDFSHAAYEDGSMTTLLTRAQIEELAIDNPFPGFWRDALAIAHAGAGQ